MGIFTKNQDNDEDTNKQLRFSPTEENNPGSNATIRKVFNTEDKGQDSLNKQEPYLRQQEKPTSEIGLPESAYSVNDPNFNTADMSNYGIENTIELMRQLPQGDIEVIITVVKKTLESINIKVPDIIEDAKKKEADIRSRAKRLEAEIRDLEDKISKRSTEIDNLQTSLDETVRVREHLQLSEPESNSTYRFETQKFQSPSSQSQTPQAQDMSSPESHVQDKEQIRQQAQVEEQVAQEVKELALETNTRE